MIVDIIIIRQLVFILCIILTWKGEIKKSDRKEAIINKSLLTIGLISLYMLQSSEWKLNLYSGLSASCSLIGLIVICRVLCDTLEPIVSCVRSSKQAPKSLKKINNMIYKFAMLHVFPKK